MSKVNGVFEALGDTFDFMARGKELYWGLWTLLSVLGVAYFTETGNELFSWVLVAMVFFNNELFYRAVKLRPGKYVYNYTITVQAGAEPQAVLDALKRSVPPKG